VKEYLDKFAAMDPTHRFNAHSHWFYLQCKGGRESWEKDFFSEGLYIFYVLTID
jgi:hypothetical protein